MDAARHYLFPLYASLLTPTWLRVLGAKVGRGTEISTALLTPKFTVIEDSAFLADDTMVASYELGGGWIHVATATIGKRAFLGNSGITAARPEGTRRWAGRGAVGGTAQVEGRVVVAGQPTDSVAPQAHRGRRVAHVPSADAPEDHARVRGDMPAGAGGA